MKTIQKTFLFTLLILAFSCSQYVMIGDGEKRSEGEDTTVTGDPPEHTDPSDNPEDKNPGDDPPDDPIDPECGVTANCYFVAPEGDDSGAGTLDQPYKTFKPAVTKAQPGDFIYALDGVFDIDNVIHSRVDQPSIHFVNHFILIQDNLDEYGWFYVNSGTVDKPITIKAYPGHTPVLDGRYANIDVAGGLVIENKSNWIISGLHFRGTTLSLMPRSDNIVIRDCRFFDHEVPDDCSNCGMIKAWDDLREGITYNNIWIMNNTFTEMYSTGFYGRWYEMDQGNSDESLINAALSAAIFLISNQGYLPEPNGGIQNLHIVDNRFDKLPQALNFKSDNQGPIFVERNVMHTMTWLSTQWNSSNTFFRNNLIYDIPKGNLRLGASAAQENPQYSGHNLTFENNTLINAGGGLIHACRGEGHTVRNNIIYTDDPDSYAIFTNGFGGCEDGSNNPFTDLHTISSDNNCFLGPSDKYDTFVLNGYSGSYDYMAQIPIYGFDRNSKLILSSSPDEIFSDPSAGDFSLIDPSICPEMGHLY